MIVRNTFFFILFVLNTFAVFSSSISGIIVEDKSGNPMPYATAELITENDSVFKAGTVSNFKGEFEFQNIETGNYLLKISSVGYKTKVINIQIIPKQKKLNLGKISLEISDNNIDEIVIQAKKTIYKESVDKTIVIPGFEEMKAASNATELLAGVTGVEVNDLNRTISLIEGGNVLVMVNGVKIGDSSYDYLSQLLPEQLVRIEITNTPSVKYDGEVTGVLNIIIKNEHLKNYSVTSAMIFASASEGLIIKSQFGKEKFRVFFNTYIYLINKYDYHNYLSRDVYLPDFNYSYTSITESSENNSLSTTFFYGVDYFISKKSSFNFTARSRFSTINDALSFYKQDSITGNLPNKLYVNNNNEVKSRLNNYSLFYSRKFSGNNHKLTFDLNYYSFLNKNTNENTFVTSTVENDTVYTQQTDNSKYSLNFSADYTYPIKEDITFETGYTFYMKKLDNMYNNTTDFEYFERRNSAYLNLLKKFSIIEIQAGIRIENSRIDINNKNYNNPLNILSSAALMKKINKHNTIRLNYGKRLQRPEINELNPFVTFSDPYNTYEGNPYLIPERTDQTALKYTYNSKKDFFLSTSFYYNTSKDVIAKTLALTGDNTFEYKYNNIASYNEYGVKVNSKFRLFKKLQIIPYAKVFKEKYEFENKINDNMSFYLSLRTILFLPKELSIIYNFSYSHWYLSLYGKYLKPPYSLIALKKGINDKSFIILFYNKPGFFFDKYTKTEITQANYSQYSEYGKYMSVMGVRFTYTFGSGKMNSVKRKLNMDNDLE